MDSMDIHEYPWIFWLIFPPSALGSVLGYLGSVSGHLGSVLGRFGGVLGRLQGVLGGLGGVSAHFGSVLEVSWRFFDRILADLQRQNGIKFGSTPHSN